MRRYLAFSAAILASAVVVGAQPLRHRVMASSSRVDLAAAIVGRARCGGATWLLTDAPTLVRVDLETPAVTSAAVKGLRRDERLWGLACPRPHEIWSVANDRMLVRLTSEGVVQSRLRLPQPRLNVFSAGEQLLLQRPPAAPATPLLEVAPGADVRHTRLWPGPMALPPAAGRIDLLAGLVACGLSNGVSLACWIANRTQITVSDGTAEHMWTVQPRFLETIAVDPAMPLWDVAAASPASVWILTSTVTRVNGQRAGGRLTRSDARGDDLGAIEVRPRPRAIVGATVDRLWVLTTSATLVEVSTP